MKKLEAKFISQELLPYLKNNLHYTFGWEAKFIRKGKYYFSDKALTKEIRNLKMCGKEFTYKFPDGSLQGTPMDGCKITEAEGYFFIKFEEDPKHVFYSLSVDVIDDFIKSGIKYLDKALCQEYGIKNKK